MAQGKYLSKRNVWLTLIGLFALFIWWVDSLPTPPPKPAAPQPVAETPAPATPPPTAAQAADTAREKSWQEGGTAAERAQMAEYCTPLMWEKMNALPGIYTVEITAPTISFMAVHYDGGNVYLQEAVYQRGDVKVSWRCHRYNDPKKGWKNIDVSLQQF